MPKIAPFNAIRPAKGFENQVVVNSHLGPTPSELTAILEENPFSYYHIFKPQFHFTQNKESSSKYFSYGKSYFKQLNEQRVFEKDARPAFYVYQITSPNAKVYLGVIALTDSEDYRKGIIKKHEKTLVEKESLLAKHIQATGLIGEPVLLAHEPNPAIQELLKMVAANQEPCCEFKDNQSMLHKVWSIEEQAVQNQFVALFAALDAVYIADGHHRCASMCRFIEDQDLPSTSMLSFLVSAEQLSIQPFHRLLNINKPFSMDAFANCVMEDFDIRFVETIPDSLAEFDFVLISADGLFYLTPKSTTDFTSLSAVERLNVSLLESQILKPCFGINDSRNEPGLTFIAGENSYQKALDFVKDKPNCLAFIMAPLKPENIFEVSDLSLAMPPKSTYIEPKLLSGLIILEFNDSQKTT